MDNELLKLECDKTIRTIALANMLLDASKEVSNYQTYQQVYGGLTDMDKERKDKANSTIDYCIEKLLELQVNIDHLIS